MHLTHDQLILLLYIYLCGGGGGGGAYTPSNLHANTYNSFVFHQQKLKQANCALTAESINKMCSIQTMDYNSGIQMNGLIHAKVWVNLKLKEAKIKKTSYCVIQFIWLSYAHKTVGTEQINGSTREGTVCNETRKDYLSVGVVQYCHIRGGHMTEYSYETKKGKFYNT